MVKKITNVPRKPERPTADALRAAMAMPEYKSATRHEVFEHYCYHTPLLEELPLLREALHHPDFVVVRAAAQSIGKLGHAAKDAALDLYEAASRPEPRLVLPQAYVE